MHHVDERLNWLAKGRPIRQQGAMTLGMFERGQVLSVVHTVIDDGAKPKGKDEPYQGYDARIELSKDNLERYRASVVEVFAVLPWDGDFADLQ